MVSNLVVHENGVGETGPLFSRIFTVTTEKTPLRAIVH